LPRWGERKLIEVEAGYVVAYGERRAEKFEEDGMSLANSCQRERQRSGFSPPSRLEIKASFRSRRHLYGRVCKKTDRHHHGDVRK